MSANTLKAIAVTAELTGTELSATALKVMDADLSAYPEAAVMRALDRCRKELKGRLTLAAVLERVEEEDGRPNADEAWAIALASADEAETVVWTEEMAQAFGVAQPVLEARDKVGARVAFRDAYERLVREARTSAAPCRWTVSIGHDESRRAAALQSAVTLKRIDQTTAMKYLPAASEECRVVAALLQNQPQALLEHKDLTESERETNRRGLEAVRAHIAELDRQAAERSAYWAQQEREEAERFAKRKAEMLERAEALMKARGDDTAAA